MEQPPKHPLKVGDCLLDNFTKRPNQIIKVEYRHDEWWYYIRSFEDGHLTVFPEGYIPYSYSVISCPDQKVIPPPPPIKVGDCVEWKKTRGIVKAIHPDGEVKVETEEEIMGVRGIAFPDIYELRPCEPKPKELVPTPMPESVIECDYRYSLKELREMARQEGLSPSGSKKEIAARLIARGIK